MKKKKFLTPEQYAARQHRRDKDRAQWQRRMKDRPMSKAEQKFLERHPQLRDEHGNTSIRTD